ncbi:MAG: phosphoglycerate kinase [Patescibacteria group bacterium]
MNLPKLADIDVSGKRALVRLDLDTKPDPQDLRVKSSFETLDFLKEKGASEIIILAHKGRPSLEATAGKPSIDESLSLKPFQTIFNKWGAKVHENLRFDPGEEANDLGFAEKLASLGDVYVNDAFASSHRNHASIVGLPKILPHAMGLRFEKEIEVLDKEFEKPIVVLISGIKEDKIEMVKKLAKVYDKVLVGGRLPEHFGDGALESVRTQNGNMVIGNLTMDKEDITLNTIERFKKEIEKAGTIILAGVLGKYEDKGHIQGTTEIFEAVAKSSAYKIAGGGDTESAISQLAISHKFDWISVGGGAMIEFLINKTLPGIEALTP